MVSPRYLIRLGLGLVVVLAAGLAFVSASPGGARSAYDDSELIAFTRADGIYVMGADGSGVHALHRGGVAAGASGLAWSPDGRRLAFTTRQGEIWTINADGSGLVRLIAAKEISMKTAGSPSWSPLGRRIAFIAFGMKDPDIWVVNADGTNAHRLLRTPHRWEVQVDWSPYGDRIAFAATSGYSLVHVYVMDTNGKHVRAINPGSMVSAAMPHWSPNGQTLAYMAWPRSPGEDYWRDAEIWIADEGERLTPRRLTNNTLLDSNPAWSPDGGKLVFVRGRNQNAIFVSPEKRSADEIYFMNADGSGITRLTHNSVGEGSPAWQPPVTTK